MSQSVFFKTLERKYFKVRPFAYVMLGIVLATVISPFITGIHHPNKMRVSETQAKSLMSSLHQKEDRWFFRLSEMTCDSLWKQTVIDAGTPQQKIEKDLVGCTEARPRFGDDHVWQESKYVLAEQKKVRYLVGKNFFQKHHNPKGDRIAVQCLYTFDTDWGWRDTKYMLNEYYEKMPQTRDYVIRLLGGSEHGFGSWNWIFFLVGIFLASWGVWLWITKTAKDDEEKILFLIGILLIIFQFCWLIFPWTPY